MSEAAKIKSDATIKKRQRIETGERSLFDQIKGDKSLLLKATWEAKTDKAYQGKVIRSRIEAMHHRKEQDLRARKAKLADLLAKEEAGYEQEFLMKLETPEQVRQRMAARLDQLKTQRDEERDNLVKNALDRTFKMETDQLRKEETTFMIAGCQLEREKQLMDKRQRLEHDIVEEQVYAKLWQIDHDKKLKREQEEAKEKKAKEQKTLEVLDWQNNLQAQRKREDQAKRAQEKTMMKGQWETELAIDR